MTDTLSAITSPLLEKFRNYRPGDIHEVAAKVHLMSGFVACKSNTLESAFWNVDKSALVVTFIGGYETTLIVEGWRLLTKCTCYEWQPARNCPHLVIAWGVIKRLVSSDTLLHMQINQQMLLDMKRYLEKEPKIPKKSKMSTLKTKLGALVGKLKSIDEVVRKTVPKYWLLIEQSGDGNSVRGGIKHGDETVYGWTVSGIPTDLARFLATNYSYEPSERYFRSFQRITGGNYPILFRNEEGKETTLHYREEPTCIAGVTFDVRGEEVHLSRSFADGTPLPANAVAHGQMVINTTTGVIMPVSNGAAWKLWESVFKELEDLDDEAWNIKNIGKTQKTPLKLHRQHNTVIVPMELFNIAAIILPPQMIDAPEINCHFCLNGVSSEERHTDVQTYLVDIPKGVAGTTAFLHLLSSYEGESYCFSNSSFRLFNPHNRSNLSGAMKTKKRLRTVIDTAFALLDESKATARTSIIRSATSTPDFLKRDVKLEAKQLITELAEQWDRSNIILVARSDGWHFLKNDHRSQARLIRILYDMFGLEAFVDDFVSVKMEVVSATLLKELPQLTARLHAEGFSIRIGSEPLESASWTFSLDATRSSQDWFELKPEIRCNGEMLTEEELNGVLEGGLLRRDGRLMLLDEISAEVMAMFAGAMPAGKKKKKGEREPVRVPRLQILDWLQLKSHGVEVKLSVEDARILDSLLNFSSLPAIPLPTGLNATLRHYQVDAWRWLAFLYVHRFGACLADDMGLGKTVQGIALLAGIMSGQLASASAAGTAHLVVAPPSLLFNWEAELARFLPSARVMLYSGSGRTTEKFAEHDVIITSYGIVQRDCDILARHNFNVIIFDETQMVKNLQAATTNAVRKLKGAFTLALTGTPVENHLGEYYAIMDLCLPGLLGTREEFSRKLSQNSAVTTARLIGRTRPFVLRRTKQLIASELPPKIEIDIPLELTAKQRVFYERTVLEVRGQVEDAYESHAPAQARIIALTAILRLRQICLAPVLASPGASDASPKIEFLAEQLAELRDEGHSVLVFSQFTGYLNLIEKWLKREGFNCLRLDGSTPVPHRKKLVQAFQNSAEPSVFLISLKAGGKGLNLTRATYVYHMDPWWNPAVENQASDRAHRIGQTEQVTITRLIMRHTIEEKMMALKEQKTQLYKAILEDGAGGGGAGLTREDFDFLLGRG